MHNLCLIGTLSSSDLAAWVQAIGSILAVIVAMIVVILQNSLEKSRTKQHQNNLITSYLACVISLTGGLREKAELLNKWCENGDTSHENLYFMLNEVDAINNALQNIPVWELDTFELTSNIVAIQGLSKTLISSIKIAESNKTNSSAWVQQTKAKLTNTISEITRILKILIDIEIKRK